jgi:hypothetical protein
MCEDTPAVSVPIQPSRQQAANKVSSMAGFSAKKLLPKIGEKSYS